MPLATRPPVDHRVEGPGPTSAREHRRYVHRVHAAFEEFGAPLVVFDREHFEAPVRRQNRTSVQPFPVERVECEKII